MIKIQIGIIVGIIITIGIVISFLIYFLNTFLFNPKKGTVILKLDIVNKKIFKYNNEVNRNSFLCSKLKLKGWEPLSKITSCFKNKKEKELILESFEKINLGKHHNSFSFISTSFLRWCKVFLKFNVDPIDDDSDYNLIVHWKILSDKKKPKEKIIKEFKEKTLLSKKGYLLFAFSLKRCSDENRRIFLESIKTAIFLKRYRFIHHEDITILLTKTISKYLSKMQFSHFLKKAKKSDIFSLIHGSSYMFVKSQIKTKISHILKLFEGAIAYSKQNLNGKPIKINLNYLNNKWYENYITIKNSIKKITAIKPPAKKIIPITDVKKKNNFRYIKPDFGDFHFKMLDFFFRNEDDFLKFYQGFIKSIISDSKINKKTTFINFSSLILEKSINLFKNKKLLVTPIINLNSFFKIPKGTLENLISELKKQKINFALRITDFNHFVITFLKRIDPHYVIIKHDDNSQKIDLANLYTAKLFLEKEKKIIILDKTNMKLNFEYSQKISTRYTFDKNENTWIEDCEYFN